MPKRKSLLETNPWLHDPKQRKRLLEVSAASSSAVEGIRAPPKRAIASTQSLSAFVKGVCDIMRRSNCASALQYVPELTWILFLRILDAQESRARLAATAQGRDFSPALRAPFRWKDWAAPFLQHVLERLKPAQDSKPGATCAIVLDEGLLFRTNEAAFVETKRKLLDECELWCVVSLPGGVFSTAGAGVKTNLPFSTRGKRTERIWYYDLSRVKVGKKTPMTLAHFGWSPRGDVLGAAELPATLTEGWREREGNAGKAFPTFARLLGKRGTAEADSDLSWTVDFAERRAAAREAMAPHLAEASAQREELVRLKDEYAALRRQKAGDDALAANRELQARAERAAREAQAKADAIDATCFDLKAVNPRARDDRDLRTPDEILRSIAAHASDIQQAMRQLQHSFDMAQGQA